MNKILKIAIILLAFAIFAGIVYGDVPPPPVNQKLGINDTNVSQLVEQNCRGCHNSTSSPLVSGSVPTRHHYLVANNKINIITNTPYGCQDCHPSTPGQGNGVLMDRNCINCHNGSAFYANKNVIAGRPHHINTNDAKNRNCKACHGSFVDSYNDGHYVPLYNKSEITPTTNFKVFNATSGRYWGGCFACHQPSAATSPNILSNKDNHHGEILGATQTLTSVKVVNAPNLDGIPETIWDNSTPITVNVSGGINTGSHKVTFKSVYTQDSVYFLATWTDPTESLRRMPWKKQADGSWKQLKTPGAKEGGENTFYEDKFAQIWDINISGFDKLGCFATCHSGENTDVKDFGNKYTPNPGEKGDIWHMKLVRTNPTGYFDDQYVDSTRYNATTAPEAGRKSDPGLVPYFNNINATGTGPTYTSADQPAPPYWIFNDSKQSFTDIYNVGDEIAAIIIRPPTGDRADITAKAVYSNGNWTMEYGRKLITGSAFDVQFSDLNKSYLFGTAIFDNEQTQHSYESGVSKLLFAPNAARNDGTPGLDCKWCHGSTSNISSPDWLDVRSCEQCHSVSSIHNIQYDYTNTSTIRGYGHIGSNNPSDAANYSWDCKGCHAWYDAGDINAIAGAIIPDITSITPNLLKTGLNSVVTITGSDFLSGSGTYTVNVSIDGTTLLTPNSATNEQIIVTVPQLTAGVHTIQVVKTGDSPGEKISKLSTLTVVIPVDMVTAKVTKKATRTTPAEITMTGTGFGPKPDPLFTDLGVWITINPKKTVKTSVVSWSDTKIVVGTPSAQIGNLVKVNALYGQDSVTIS